MSFNLLTLLDDIASTLDDVSIMTKLAVKKTSGLITDDLALNVGQVDGLNPADEIPTVLKIFLGSLVNKAIIIPFVLLLTFKAPLILSYILLLGGVYLCYEGSHKVLEKLINKKHKKPRENKVPVKEKVWGAIKTDFVLSIEIMVIAQSSIEGNLFNQALVLCVIGIAVSIIIYGLVALLVKIDDLGLYLIKRKREKIGMTLVNLMPNLMKFLGIVGTVAMFLVGGEIFSHHFHLDFIKFSFIQSIFVGLIVGFVAVVVISLVKKITILKRIL